ncbi:MAG TPA: zinc-binding alcohol dehydrogenase family protein [Shinella sp.]|jgi:hypothetical protein|uniref:zinc-binding alcohol dehydrogenase family protein n=1 Tax=Shinella sp. TaxID=1870904 RepID=UPI002E14998A|nr:zinc-binding alcohol dehydrogenase family protein [Shinella sp.]
MTKKIANQVAWQRTAGLSLQIGPADVRKLESNEILIRNAAVAINPIDWLLQDDALLPWLDYPMILGSDVAGEVAAVGDSVKRFKVGDRVIGQAVSTTVNEAAQGAFQNYTVVLEHMAAPIPDWMPFTAAAVLPLGLGTAAVGLYGKTHLALKPPSHAPQSREEVVLVWGGSSSVGCNAIQLAAASGYRCITVASLSNSGMLKGLGAEEVLDRGSPNIVEDVIEATRGRRLAGTLHATGNMDDCFAAVTACEGAKTVAATLMPPERRPGTVEATHIIGPSLKDDEVGPLIYRDFMPRALAEGSFVPAPPAKIVGHGLGAIQKALEIQKAGVSAAKIVVTIDSKMDL